MILPRVEHPVRVTVLVENTARGDRLGGEHGLAYWIECGPKRILFDTGQGDLFDRNAEAMGIDASTASAIVISHGHYDHAGGLPTALKLNRHAPLYIHPAAFTPKFTRDADGTGREIGMRGPVSLDIRSAADLIPTPTPTEVVPGIRVSGRVPRAHNFEDAGGPFFRDAACTIPDPLDDDQAVYFRCKRGLVVLLGCAHAGVVNTISHIQAISGGWSVHAVIGGMHLRSASRARIDATIRAFREHHIGRLAPCHCTGAHVEAELREQFPSQYAPCHAGSQFVFE